MYDVLNMAKKNAVPSNDAELQPDELNLLKEVAKEFITRMKTIENEIDLLKDDRKELVEEFKEKLDVRTFQAALRVLKIERGVQHKHTFDTFLEVLKDELSVA